MAYPVEVFIPERKHISFLRSFRFSARALRSKAASILLLLSPDDAFGRKERGRPGIAGCIVASLLETPGHEGGTPGMPLTQSRIAQVFSYPLPVIAVRLFAHANLCEVDLLKLLPGGPGMIRRAYI